MYIPYFRDYQKPLRRSRYRDTIPTSASASVGDLEGLGETLIIKKQKLINIQIPAIKIVGIFFVNISLLIVLYLVPLWRL